MFVWWLEGLSRDDAGFYVWLKGAKPSITHWLGLTVAYGRLMRMVTRWYMPTIVLFFFDMFWSDLMCLK